LPSTTTAARRILSAVFPDIPEHADAVSLPLRHRHSFLASAISASQTSITVTGGASTPPTPFNLSVCVCSPTGATGETMTVTNVSGTTWTVTRGQGGHYRGCSRILDDAIDRHCSDHGSPRRHAGSVGQRVISWPVDNFGIAGLRPAPSKTYMSATEPTRFNQRSAVPMSHLHITSHLIPPQAGSQSTRHSSVAAYNSFFPSTTNQVVAGGCPLTTAYASAAREERRQELPYLRPTREPGKICPSSFKPPAWESPPWTTLTRCAKSTSTTGARSITCGSLSSAPTAALASTRPFRPVHVDHEEMSVARGRWRSTIAAECLHRGHYSDCFKRWPATGNGFASRGFGTIAENTTNWVDCSYQVWLKTRPG